MWLRRAFYRWLFPAVLVLPMWLLIGWSVFQAGGWVFLWVLFIAIPSVAIAQVVNALVVRARPSVAKERAVSWTDVGAFGLWQVLTVIVGCYPQRWFGLALAAAIAAAVLLFWLSFRQLRRELERGQGLFFRPGPGEQAPSGRRIDPGDVVIVTDADPDPEDDRRDDAR